MRQFVVVVLAGLVFAPAGARAGDWDRPIPQDAEWVKQRAPKSLAWNRRTLAAAYKKIGKKDPRWDKPALEALERIARHFAQIVDPRVRIEEVYPSAKKAVDAGCDDPLILYVYARSSLGANYPGAKEIERRYTAAAAGMERSDYPPLRRAAALKAAALTKAARKDLTAEERKEVVRMLDAALALLPKSVKEDERNYETENIQFGMPMAVVETLRSLNGDYQAAFDHVDAILEKTPDMKAIRLQTRGNFLIRYGWAARSNAFANKVTEEGWKKFSERLTEARDVLNKCWALKPGDYRTANFMLSIEKGMGDNRAEMEKWFERAMKASPIDKQACEQKLDWLDPKWHGNLKDMMAFGKACRETKNWQSGITLLVAEAHRRASMYLSEEERKKYLASEEVREEIKDVYEEYLKHYPDDIVERSRYAAFCFVCGRYAESDKQFKILGDNYYGFQGYWPLKWMKEVRAFVANKARQEKPAK